MQYDSIIITLADDDEDDRLFFTDAFEELKINTIVNTVNNGRELLEFSSCHRRATIPACVPL